MIKYNWREHVLVGAQKAAGSCGRSRLQVCLWLTQAHWYDAVVDVVLKRGRSEAAGVDQSNGPDRTRPAADE